MGAMTGQRRICGLCTHPPQPHQAQAVGRPQAAKEEQEAGPMEGADLGARVAGSVRSVEPAILFKIHTEMGCR